MTEFKRNLLFKIIITSIFLPFLFVTINCLMSTNKGEICSSFLNIPNLSADASTKYLFFFAGFVFIIAIWTLFFLKRDHQNENKTMSRKDKIWMVAISILLIIFLKTYCNPSGFSCSLPSPSWLMAITQFLCLAIVYYSGKKLKNLRSHTNAYVAYLLLYLILILIGAGSFIYLYLNDQLF